jgi:hypothetical protein
MPIATVDTVDRPLAMGYGLALGERLFRLAVSPQRQLTIETAPLEAPRINTTSSPEESSAEFGLIFARSSFDGGDNLFRAHIENAAPNRYWDSYGVSIRPAEPGEFPQIELLHTTSQLDANTADPLRMAYDATGDALYTTAGTTLRRIDTPASAPSAVADDPSAAEGAVTVYDVAVLGDVVYAALGSNGIHRKVAGTWAHWSDTPATRIWALKGRIVATDGIKLYEVIASGVAPTAITTLKTGITHTDACDGGSHILVGADDGYVYAYSTESGSLVLSAQTLFEGEQVTALGQSQGVVAVGTQQANVGRFYVGALDANGQVVDQQLIRTWGTTGTATPQYPHRIVGTRASLVTAIQDGTDTCLWRYDLISGGMSRDLCATAVSEQVRGIEVIDGVKFFGIDGNGTYAEDTDTYVSEGWLIGPLGDFYSAASKSWIGARLETGDMAATGGTVELYYSLDPEALADDDDAAWTRVTRRTTGAGDPGEHVLSNVVGRQLAGMVKVYPPSGSSATPKVRSFSFRAYPSSGDEDIILTIPVNVSDQIERAGRRRVKVPGRGATEFNSLRLLEGKPTTATLYRPDLMVRGLVEKVSTPIPVITRRGSVTWVSEVVVRGREVGSAGTTTGVGSLGTYHLLGTTPSFGSST